LTTEATTAVGWRIRTGVLPTERPVILGILNVTPDSFSDGGELSSPGAALDRAARFVAAGADILDVGGESTRPGAIRVPTEQQIERVVPVVELLSSRFDVPLSIDTRDAGVARAAIAAGASIVNDVSGLGDPRMTGVVREFGAGLILMHMRGEPASMQEHAQYGDVVAEVSTELRASLTAAVDAGVDPHAIVVDPGIGFAKTAAHNLAILARLHALSDLGRPILVGPSRKAFIGLLSGGVPPGERLAGTIAACVAALLGDARLFRVHDVAPIRQALDVAYAIFQAGTTRP
jgi:dihydropteroate synthase